jgi:hypothetical protein
LGRERAFDRKTGKMDQDSALFKQESGRWREPILRSVARSRPVVIGAWTDGSVFAAVELTSIRARRCAP